MDGWRSLRPPESFFVARRRQDRPSGASTVLTANDDDAGWPTTCTPVPCRTRVPTGLVDVLPPLPLRPSSLPPPASWSPPQSRHRDHDPLAMSPASLTYAHGNHHVSLIVYSAEGFCSLNCNSLIYHLQFLVGLVVHEPDPKISDIGTTCGGKIQQCFSERQIPIDNEIT